MYENKLCRQFFMKELSRGIKLECGEHKGRQYFVCVRVTRSRGVRPALIKSYIMQAIESAHIFGSMTIATYTLRVALVDSQRVQITATRLARARALCVSGSIVLIKLCCLGPPLHLGMLRQNPRCSTKIFTNPLLNNQHLFNFNQETDTI